MVGFSTNCTRAAIEMTDSAGFALHRPDLLEPLTRGEEKIARLMRDGSRAFPARTILIDAGAEHEYVYRVRRGWAGRVRTLKDGRSQFILIFLPGDLFAVKSMFVTVHPDRVEVLSNAVIEQVHQRTLRAAFDSDRDVATRCTWQILEEERRLHNWVVGLGQGNADERTAMLLLDFRSRLILSHSIPPDALEFELPMTQQQLGDHLGITSVHVNRVLKGMRRGGIVDMHDHRITIINLDALVRIADPLMDSHERSTRAFFGPSKPTNRQEGS